MLSRATSKSLDSLSKSARQRSPEHLVLSTSISSSSLGVCDLEGVSIFFILIRFLTAGFRGKDLADDDAWW
jgi:hypothetical protein